MNPTVVSRRAKIYLFALICCSTALFFLIVSNTFLTRALIAQKRHVVLVPSFVTPNMTVEGKIGANYLYDLAHSFTHQILTVTSTSDHKRAREHVISNFVAISFQEEIQKQLSEMWNVIDERKVTTFFSGEKVSVNTAERTVVLSGKLLRFSHRTQLDETALTVEVRFVDQFGTVRVSGIRMVENLDE